MTEQRVIRLAVIGAGPKATAIAAKASVLNRTKFGELSPVKFEIVAFDHQGVGAHWEGGKAGYTDGEQRLCTLIERDLGFPYASRLTARIEALAKLHLTPDLLETAKLSLNGLESESELAELPRLGSLVDIELHRKFSWHAYQASQNTYSSWVDAGRKPPGHREFADYLKWAFAQSGASLIKARVQSLSVTGKKWVVRAKSGNGRSVDHGLFDGVVATGPGPARAVSPGQKFKGKLFNGVDFWTHRAEVKKLVDKPWATIAILGGGGTGAAVLAWFARNGYCNKEITLVTDQATVYTRTDNWFESRLFSDDTLWRNLSSKSQSDFFDRVNRGVVWNNVIPDIERLAQLTIVEGRASNISSSGRELKVTVPNAISSNLITANLVVDATGFNPWYFMDMLPQDFKPPDTAEKKREFKGRLQESLSWKEDQNWPFPPLHAPSLAEKYGPGLGSLMSLGSMSDRVLDRYLTID